MQAGSRCPGVAERDAAITDILITLGCALLALFHSMPAAAGDGDAATVVASAVGSAVVRRVGAAGHDDAYTYRLPFGDSDIAVLQGYGSRFSHRGTEHFTVDFGLPEGSRVLSARSGVVTEVESGHAVACASGGCAWLANRVVVRHDDGSVARYFHLAPGSVVVVTGEHVSRGQLLALSGNTGMSTTPHLHFGVYMPVADGALQSVPTRFATDSGVVELRQGRRYSHP